MRPCDQEYHLNQAASALTFAKRHLQSLLEHIPTHEQQYLNDILDEIKTPSKHLGDYNRLVWSPRVMDHRYGDHR